MLDSTPYDAALFNLMLGEPRQSFHEDALSLYRQIMELADAEDVRLDPAHHAVLYLTASDLRNAVIANPESVDSLAWDGRTPLHWAVMRQDLSKVLALLQLGANLNIRDRAGRTALHFAIFTGSRECISTLLSWGSDPYLPDAFGNTALHILITSPKSSNTGTISRLLEAGAARCSTNNQGLSPFQMATAARFRADDREYISWAPRTLEVLPFLDDDHGVTVINAVARGHTSLFRALCKQGWDPGVIGPGGRSILYAAGLFGTLGIIEAIEEVIDRLQRLDPDLEDCYGWTAIDYFDDRINQEEEKLWGDQSRPTPEEVKAFERLINGLRRR